MGLFLTLLLDGCVNPASKKFRPNLKADSERAAQTRRFEGMNEPAILAACASVLQDLGFSLEESDASLGVIVASKDRTARKQQTTSQVIAQTSAEVALSVAASLLTAQVVCLHDFDPPERQVIRASLVATPVAGGSGQAFDVRAMFQRIVYSRHNRVLSAAALADPMLTQDFFAALSKSTFLEAQQL